MPIRVPASLSAFLYRPRVKEDTRKIKQSKQIGKTIESPMVDTVGNLPRERRIKTARYWQKSRDSEHQIPAKCWPRVIPSGQSSEPAYYHYHNDFYSLSVQAAAASTAAWWSIGSVVERSII